MKQLLVMLSMFTLINATDIVIKTDGTNADASGLSIQNSSATELMILEGNGDVAIDGTTLTVDATKSFVGVGTASPSAQLHVTGTDGLLIQGIFESGTIANLGAGARLHFYPKKAAFRVGAIDGTQWDDANVGDYSMATGYQTTASGYASVAMGYNNTASGFYSYTMGLLNAASGDFATSMGHSNSTSGDYSCAIGYDNTASGNHSLGLGSQLTAESAYEAVLGRYNTDYSPDSETSWDTDDRLLVVGNGTASDSKSDAFIIYKNGNATLAGTLTESSDIRLKERIRPIDTALNKVLRLDGKYFYWNTLKPHDTEAEQIGLIAQELQKVLPQLVSTDQTEEAYLSVNYQGMIPVLINAIKEQQLQIDALKTQLDNLDQDLTHQPEAKIQTSFFKRLFPQFSKVDHTENLADVSP